jgi:hypothetical protein
MDSGCTAVAMRILRRARRISQDIHGMETKGELTAPIHPQTAQSPCLVISCPLFWGKSYRQSQYDEHERQGADVGRVHRGRFVVQILVSWSRQRECRIARITYICGRAARRWDSGCS